MSIKFLVLGGGLLGLGGGGEVPILFYGRGDFSEQRSRNQFPHPSKEKEWRANTHRVPRKLDFSAAFCS